MAGGAGGRPPKPTKLKQILGTINVTRQNRDEPMPRRGVPKCPAFLGKVAKAKWRQLVGELDRLHLLTVVDDAALAAFCVAWGEFEASTRTVEKDGRFVTNASGTLVTHPAVVQMRTAWRAIKDFSALFGLDPSSRVKIRAPKVEASDPFEQFLEEKAGG